MSTGYRAVVWMMFATVAPVSAQAQVSSNGSLIGKYFFRQVLLQTSSGSTVSQTQSAWGTLTFDGAGNFAISGSQISGTSPAVPLTGNGTYMVNPGGYVTLSNPLLTGVTINARLGAQALVGSSTEAGANTFDLLVALHGSNAAVTNQILTGPYWVSSLEFPNGGLTNIRETNFELTADARGDFSQLTVNGQAANLGNALTTQTVAAGTYLMNVDGSGTMTFPASTGLDATTQLIEGVKDIYVAQDGSFFIGGSGDAGGHGIIAGIKAWNGGVSSATNASWNGLYFAASLQYDTSAKVLSSMVGSVDPTSAGAVWEQHTRTPGGLSDTSSLLIYSLNPDGSGTYTNASGRVDLPPTTLVFTNSGLGTSSTSTYQFVLGSSVVPQTGSGSAPFLNPLGVFSAASYAPSAPVSPGEFVVLYGSGLATSTMQATIPYPTAQGLGGTTLTVNGIAAPIYWVSANQINAVVPYGVTGSTATFVATVNGLVSLPITVPLAPTSPGVFSLSANGIGDGAIEHPGGAIVNQANPAKPGEIIQVFLTGLGAVSPAVPDGTAAPSNPTAKVTAAVTAYVGGIKVTNIQFDGLSPDLASLYQLNIQIPSNVPAGPQTLEISTADGSTSIVDVWIGS